MSNQGTPDEVQKKVPQHFVCTHDQARKLIDQYNEYYIAICGCRQGRGSCSHSRMDVCLMFNAAFTTGTEKRPATRAEALKILTHADEKGLVSRPFRKPDDPNVLDGICFCCPECCYYFNHDDEPCDKGSLVQSTDLDTCTACGMCVSVCYFGARSIVDGQLVVDDKKCYGCGLCVDACPGGSVTMK